MADICEHLSGRCPTTTDPLLVGALLGEILDANGPALVVVDDVWTEEQVNAFSSEVPDRPGYSPHGTGASRRPSPRSSKSAR
ncbi:hypothetical protein LV779_14010 [Streptomyces thinghirensis]|nr:hypothetical protein [Streptomyces thinghirensis]